MVDRLFECVLTQTIPNHLTYHKSIRARWCFGWLGLAAPGHPPPDMIGFNTSNPNATNKIVPDGAFGV